MAKFSRILVVILNLLNYAAGIVASVFMIFKLDFAAVFYINGMTPNMALIFNMLMFQVGIVLVSVVVEMMLENKTKAIVVTFPMIYMILPAVAGLIGLYFGIVGATIMEKLVVIAGSVVYVVLSSVLIYFSSKVFELTSKSE